MICRADTTLLLTSIRRLATALAISVAVAGTMTAVQPAEAQTVSLIAAHTGAPGNSVHVFFDEFAKRMKAATKDRLTFRVHPSGELGGDDQLLQSVKLGTVHMTSVATANMGALTTAYFWTDLPYVFASREGAQKVFADSELTAQLAKKVQEDVGTIVLGYIHVGGFRMLQNTKRPLKTPDDARGLKFRVTASPVDVALIRAWGGLPTPVAWAETFTSVQQGVVDGLNLQPSWSALNGFGQVIKHATLNRAVMAFHVVQFNSRRWSDLSPEFQAAIKKAVAEALMVANAADAKAEADFIAKLKSQGVAIYEPTPSEIELWRGKAMAVTEQMKDRVDAKLLAKVAEIQK